MTNHSSRYCWNLETNAQFKPPFWKNRNNGQNWRNQNNVETKRRKNTSNENSNNEERCNLCYSPMHGDNDCPVKKLKMMQKKKSERGGTTRADIQVKGTTSQV